MWHGVPFNRYYNIKINGTVYIGYISLVISKYYLQSNSKKLNNASRKNVTLLSVLVNHQLQTHVTVCLRNLQHPSVCVHQLVGLSMTKQSAFSA